LRCHKQAPFCVLLLSRRRGVRFEKNPHNLLKEVPVMQKTLYIEVTEYRKAAVLISQNRRQFVYKVSMANQSAQQRFFLFCRWADGLFLLTMLL